MGVETHPTALVPGNVPANVPAPQPNLAAVHTPTVVVQPGQYAPGVIPQFPLAAPAASATTVSIGEAQHSLTAHAALNAQLSPAQRATVTHLLTAIPTEADRMTFLSDLERSRANNPQDFNDVLARMTDVRNLQAVHGVTASLDASVMRPGTAVVTTRRAQLLLDFAHDLRDPNQGDSNRCTAAVALANLVLLRGGSTSEYARMQVELLRDGQTTTIGGRVMTMQPEVIARINDFNYSPDSSTLSERSSFTAHAYQAAHIRLSVGTQSSTTHGAYANYSNGDGIGYIQAIRATSMQDSVVFVRDSRPGQPVGGSIRDPEMMRLLAANGASVQLQWGPANGSHGNHETLAHGVMSGAEVNALLASRGRGGVSVQTEPYVRIYNPHGTLGECPLTGAVSLGNGEWAIPQSTFLAKADVVIAFTGERNSSERANRPLSPLAIERLRVLGLEGSIEKHLELERNHGTTPDALWTVPGGTPTGTTVRLASAAQTTSRADALGVIPMTSGAGPVTIQEAPAAAGSVNPAHAAQARHEQLLRQRLARGQGDDDLVG